MRQNDEEEYTDFERFLIAKGKPAFDYEPPTVKRIMATWERETLDGFETDEHGNPTQIYRNGSIQILLHQGESPGLHVCIAEKAETGIVYMCDCFSDAEKQMYIVLQQVARGLTTVQEVISRSKGVS